MTNSKYKYNKKVRIRTKSELQIRKNEFLKICNILNNMGINYFLQTGVLLGAIRNKNFIAWDWDVEFSVFPNEMLPKMDALISMIKSSNFKIKKVDNNFSSAKIDFIGVLPGDVTFYTIFVWNHDKAKKIFWRKNYKVPEHFIINMKKIEFLKKKHYAPYPPKSYLKYHYGNWKKPLRTSNKKIYMRREYSGINPINETFNFLLNNIKRFVLKILNFT